MRARGRRLGTGRPDVATEPAFPDESADPAEAVSERRAGGWSAAFGAVRNACLPTTVWGGEALRMLPLCIAFLALPTPAPASDSAAFESAAFAPAFGLAPLPVPQQKKSRSHWAKGRMVMQGFIGVSEYDTLEVDGGSGVSVDGSGEDAATAPVIGGGAQWKLGGEKIDFGIEAMFGVSWRSNATAIAVGGGGAAVAVDVDSFLFEIYGGPVANMFLGDSGKTRVYVSAGPLVEWVDYSQGNDFENIDDSGSGFGTGWYARTGIEFALSGGTMMGVGFRWTDSKIDLDGGLGDLDLAGYQVALTVTQGF